MLEKIKSIVEEQLCIEDVEITEATSFKEDLHADSLDLFELVMGIEEEFGFKIPSEDLNSLETVGDVVKYLQDKGIVE